MPEVVDNIEQVKISRLLGVVFSDKLDFDEHVSYVLSTCSQRLYLNYYAAKECLRGNYTKCLLP